MSDATTSAKRVAAIYDIHGNLPALEAVLEDMRQAGVDHVVVGGDVIRWPAAPGRARESARALAANAPARD